jgi:hypothetical protein
VVAENVETERTILWRRLDRVGQEAARIARVAGGWQLSGSTAFSDDAGACGLSYAIECDEGWRTRRGSVRGFVGSRSIAVEIEADTEAGRWRLNGVAQPPVDGCTDLDLNFSPSTNLLPIRRLTLREAEESSVRAAWLRFPSFALEPLEQTYRRLSERVYRYESAGGSFTADLEVDASGLVTLYPGFFEEVGEG